MYQVSNSTALLRAHRRLLVRERTGGAAVPRTVFLLGLTSLFTDISSEMVVTILPLYLVYVGGFTPLAFGVIDGIYNGAAALVGLASGFIGDRFRRHKEVAAAGYGLSAVCKLAAGHRRHRAVGHRRDRCCIDRIGKGIRTAPRDAMISLSTPERQLGAAFGVHRALDTTGAMIGPLLAFGAAGRSRRWPSTRSSSSASSSRSSAWASSSCSSSPSRRATRRSAPSQRRALAARGRRAAARSRATARC